MAPQQQSAETTGSASKPVDSPSVQGAGAALRERERGEEAAAATAAGGAPEEEVEGVGARRGVLPWRALSGRSKL